jgi:hypothetical protein
VSSRCRTASRAPSSTECECGDETCFDKLTVSLGEYRDVRSRDDWFLIAPGHEKVEVERVVERRDGYWVVEKERLEA